MTDRWSQIEDADGPLRRGDAAALFGQMSLALIKSSTLAAAAYTGSKIDDAAYEDLKVQLEKVVQALLNANLLASGEGGTDA